MTYIDYLNNFNRWVEHNYLTLPAQVLYIRLLDVFNRAGWPEWVSVDTIRMMSMVQTTSNNTMLRARDALSAAGFIEYRKGRKGAPNRYRLSHFCADIAQNTAQETALNTAQNTAQETAHIYKTKNKTKTKTIEEKTPSVSKRIFKPPTVEEVRAYCRERGNDVDAERFVDFYASKGWRVGNQPMKDWKAAVRTWERRDTKKPEKPWEYDYGDMEGSL